MLAQKALLHCCVRCINKYQCTMNGPPPLFNVAPRHWIPIALSFLISNYTHVSALPTTSLRPSLSQIFPGVPASVSLHVSPLQHSPHQLEYYGSNAASLGLPDNVASDRSMCPLFITTEQTYLLREVVCQNKRKCHMCDKCAQNNILFYHFCPRCDLPTDVIKHGV